ncbi:MAG: peptide chain release factor N(5)-glutamine methyltransferase [Defluviitaleaceae bacterium]|nr:peptide chain release factor N(5)-glutamine methyltransferase [Defluviitaleaceae bacterium]
MNSLSLDEAIRQGANILQNAGIETAWLDAQLLAAFVLGQDRLYVLTNPQLGLTPEQGHEFFALIERRKKFEPVAYIVKECEFMGLRFAVNEHVLIPRPDTEILVEAAIAKIRECGIRRVLEIGTGSGCIAVSLAVNCPDVHVITVDVSPKALNVARRNAEVNKVSERISFAEGDVFADVCEELAVTEKFGMIISNPPYISAGEMAQLEPNVKNFEPHTALFGGDDGLDFYREISRRAPSLLEPSGVIMFEIGCDQAMPVHNILSEHGLADITTMRDLADKDRVVYGTYHRA